MSKSKWGRKYYSFDELCQEEYGMKPLSKKTNDTQKLEAQQEKFEGVCPYCKERAKFIPATNIVVCVNPSCKGKKVVVKGDPATDETDYVKYVPFIRILSDKGYEIGNTLFGE